MPTRETDTARDHKSTANTIGDNDCLHEWVESENRAPAEGGTGGSYPPLAKWPGDVQTIMAITTNDTTTTIALADVGCETPPESTVTINELTDDVLEVTRNGHTFTVEIGLGDIAEVTLRNKTRPERVPDWIVAVATSEYDVREVRL